MKDLTNLKKLVDEVHAIQPRLVAEFRVLYETEEYEGMTCASDEEMAILEKLDSDRGYFEDCTVDELMLCVGLLLKWQGILED